MKNVRKDKRTVVWCYSGLYFHKHSVEWFRSYGFYNQNKEKPFILCHFATFCLFIHFVIKNLSYQHYQELHCLVFVFTDCCNKLEYH